MINPKSVVTVVSTGKSVTVAHDPNVKVSVSIAADPISFVFQIEMPPAPPKAKP